jgi:hypothetical protein
MVLQDHDALDTGRGHAVVRNDDEVRLDVFRAQPVQQPRYMVIG